MVVVVVVVVVMLLGLFLVSKLHLLTPNCRLIPSQRSQALQLPLLNYYLQKYCVSSATSKNKLMGLKTKCLKVCVEF